MKKWIVVSAALAAQSFVVAPAQAESMEVALLQEAIFSGKTSLDLRLRTEYVDYETTPETDATTLRTVLGYKTGDYHGLKAFVEFENVSTLGNGDYNSGTTGYGNKKTQYGLIADPALTQVNQSYLEGYGFKAGRQKIIYDNARFVGDVGWRQNDQTFDAVSFSNGSWVKDLTLSAAYVSRVNNIYGVTRAVEAPFANIRYAAFPQAKVSAFYYGVEEKTAPTSSWQHAGLRVDGAISAFLYELSWAQQSDYADATSATVPEADYTDIQLGYKIGPVTVKVEQEVLEKGFKTPLATLHAFNGWADRFLTTPGNGLEDTNLKLFATLAGYNFVLAGHDFQAEASNEKFGQEVDFSVSKAVTSKVTAMLKYSEFNADGTVAGFTNDTRKAWLQFAYKM
ncbi:MAG TPA: alginate export family protein [Moraxellaceae bacterium]|nr:alginate export family protein [Moraxellaceae bacterium]